MNGETIMIITMVAIGVWCIALSIFATVISLISLHKSKIPGPPGPPGAMGESGRDGECKCENLL